MNKFSSAVAKLGEAFSPRSSAPSNNPPPTVPGYDDSLERDQREFYAALHEVKMTESAIEQEMKPGGCLQHYELTPDEAHYINGDTWLGGLHDRTVNCTNGNVVSGMAFADLEKRGACAYGCCRLRFAPCCGLWRCFLFRRYKIGVKSNGQVQIANNFPDKKGWNQFNSDCCAFLTCLTLGEFESTKRYEERTCRATATNDGKRIIKLEEGIAHQRNAIKASEVGAQRRGEVPTADVVAETAQVQHPYWQHWREEATTSAPTPPNAANNAPVVVSPEPNIPPAAASPVPESPSAPSSDEPNSIPVAYVDPKNPPVAVAVPMER